MCKITPKYQTSKLSNHAIGLISRLFANGPRDQGSIPSWAVPKTQKIALDAASLNTQHYKVMCQGYNGAIQEMEKGFSLHLGVVAIEKEAFVSPTLLL